MYIIITDVHVTFKKTIIDIFLCNRLEYDPETNDYSNADGVQIQVPGFGDTESVEFLDEFGIIPMFHEFVEYFVDRGYVRGESICAAPYDWRLSAGIINDMKQSFQ